MRRPEVALSKARGGSWVGGLKAGRRTAIEGGIKLEEGLCRADDGQKLMRGRGKIRCPTKKRGS